jgi:DNA-binding transcriptional LysR family regulator
MSFSLEKFKNIDLEKLNHFYLIFRERSIKKVSEEFNISSSTLRHSLSTIESKLELKLYQTSKKTFIPTDDAKNLFELCKSLIEVTNTYQKGLVGRSEGPLKENLIIITTTTLANFYLPNILKRFDNYHPEVEVKVYCGSEYMKLKDYAFDVIIGPEINNINLVKYKIGKAEYKLYCSSTLKKKLAHINSPKELKGENLLLFSGEHFLDSNLIRNNKVKVISNSYPFLLNMCHQGLGILSCFNIKALHALRINLDIEELCPNYITETEQGYFYYNRFTDKGTIIRKLYNITEEYFKETL